MKNGLTKKQYHNHITEIGTQKTFIYPSDVCTILRPAGNTNNPRFVCLYISSLLSQATGSKAEKLVWIDTKEETNQSSHFITSNGRLICSLLLNVNHIPVVLDHICSDDSCYAQPAGTLRDGTKYLVYRAAFYADDFKEKRSQSNVNNVCGVYLRPFG